jgi:glycosidase
MKNFFIYHEPKSKFAYLYDEKTVHLRVITSKNSVHKIRVLYGDPFYYVIDKSTNKWIWNRENNDSSLMIKEYETKDFEHFFFEAIPSTKRMKYAFIIDDLYFYGSKGLIPLAKNKDVYNDLVNYFNFPFLNEEDLFKAPSWVKHTNWYSIFPERFSNGDTSNDPMGTLPWGQTNSYSNHQTFGGDLQGIIDHLNYIHDLGFNGIYLTPIFKSDSNHKYDINDYFEIDPTFGTKDTLKKLVQKAHDLNIKIVLDAVFNHCGFRHPFFQDVIKNGKNSKYYTAFHIIDESKPVLSFKINQDGTINHESLEELHKNPLLLNYRTFAFTPYMPKIKQCHPLWKDYLLNVATYWIEEFDIDGWRLDVSDEVPHTFWRDFRKAVKSVKSDAYIVGENWTNSYPWLKGDQYDAVMNYELLFPLWDYFGHPNKRKTTTSTDFKYQINHVLTSYPKNVLKSMYNLLDSHDTSRILDICNNQISRAMVPYVFLFSFSGSPSVFYGGEIGLSGGHDPDNRRCMIWDESKQNTTMKAHTKRLIELRKEYSDFKSVDINWLDTLNDHYIIYQKNTLYFILSRSEDTLTISLPKSLKHKLVTDIYHKKTLLLEEHLVIKPFEFFILTVQK